MFAVSTDHTAGEATMQLVSLPESLKLNPGQSTTFHASFTAPSNVVAGTYFLSATANFPTKPADKNPADNTIFSSNSIAYV